MRTATIAAFMALMTVCVTESEGAQGDTGGSGPALKHIPAAPEELEPLQVELPEPSFGVGAWYYASPNLEEPSFERRRFLVPKGTECLSRGKPVTASVAPRFGELEQVTDGVKELAVKHVVELDPGLQWVQVDLGSEYTLNAIVVWHFFGFVCVYYDVAVQASNDASFRRNVTILYSNDWDNSSGLG